MTGISVIINTLNEEKNLPAALSSVKAFADEVVICDMLSDDRTVAIAKKFGARIFTHHRTNYVEPARNYAISKAKGPWILILDADEVLPKKLAQKLNEISKASKSLNYYRLPRKNIIFGKWVMHSRWWPDYNIRFFKKGFVSWSEVIHSVPMTTGNGFDIDAKEENAIIHNHYETIEQFIARLNRYTTEHAKVLISGGYKFKWQDLIRKSSNEFLSRYFFGEGYKDGLHGLVLAGLQGFSEFIMYLKVWQYEKFDDQKLNPKDVIISMKEAEKDYHYWQADTLLKEHGGLMNRFKRKFRLS